MKKSLVLKYERYFIQSRILVGRFCYHALKMLFHCLLICIDLMRNVQSHLCFSSCTYVSFFLTAFKIFYDLLWEIYYDVPWYNFLDASFFFFNLLHVLFLWICSFPQSCNICSFSSLNTFSNHFSFLLMDSNCTC